MNAYEGSYDLKYYLDRQPVEKPSSDQKLNTHLRRNRVLVFVTYRKKTDVPLSDIALCEKQGSKYFVPKNSKSLQYQLGHGKNRTLTMIKVNTLKVRYKAEVLDFYPNTKPLLDVPPAFIFP